jgi:transposase
MSEEEVGSATLCVTSMDVAEVAVISERDCEAVRALRERGAGKKAIARQLGLAVKTVRKWLRTEWAPQRRPRASSRGPLKGFEQFIEARAPEVGFNGAVLLRELRLQGYEGSYPTVQRFVRPLRTAWRGNEATVRFETRPGQQSQVDWGETQMWIGGVRQKVHIFVMVLGYSRRTFARAYGNERIESLLDGHAEAFTHFGGITETILYDNPRTIVKSKDESKGTVVWNGTFKDFIDRHGVEPKLCRYYRAQTKGKVESGVKYVKRNALAGRQFESLDALNAWLIEWCITIADQRIHGTTHERPAERFDREERSVLQRYEVPSPSTVERMASRVVPRDALVMIETNRYPVPYTWVGHQVEVRITSGEVIFRAHGDDPVRHIRISGKYKRAVWNGPRREIPRPSAPGGSAPPRFDPCYLAAIGEVDARSLETYAQLAEVHA